MRNSDKNIIPVQSNYIVMKFFIVDMVLAFPKSNRRIRSGSFTFKLPAILPNY